MSIYVVAFSSTNERVHVEYASVNRADRERYLDGRIVKDAWHYYIRPVTLHGLPDSHKPTRD